MLSNSKYVYTLTKLPSSFYSFLFEASVFDGIKLASSDAIYLLVLSSESHVMLLLGKYFMLMSGVTGPGYKDRPS